MEGADITAGVAKNPAESPPARLEQWTESGGPGSMNRSVPSSTNELFDTSNLISRRRHAPSALNGRMANATAQFSSARPVFVTETSWNSVVPFR